MTHYLLTTMGELDRRAIHARAKSLWLAAKARGDDRPFGEDLSYAYRVARGVRTGTFSQNRFRFDPGLPFGGFKQSGLGREGGREGLASFTEFKSVLLDT